jgi:ketosteroid isomerase-like protein
MTPAEQLMKDCVEAWGQGDLGPIRRALHDDVVWISAAAVWSDGLRSGGVHRGRAGVIALLAKLSTAYFNSYCKAKEIISSGEIVWGLFDLKSRYSAGRDEADKTVTTEMAFRWRVRDGKLIEGQTFFDTAGLLAQQGYKLIP